MFYSAASPRKISETKNDITRMYITASSTRASLSSTLYSFCAEVVRKPGNAVQVEEWKEVLTNSHIIAAYENDWYHERREVPQKVFRDLLFKAITTQEEVNEKELEELKEYDQIVLEEIDEKERNGEDAIGAITPQTTLSNIIIHLELKLKLLAHRLQKGRLSQSMHDTLAEDVAEELATMKGMDPDLTYYDALRIRHTHEIGDWRRDIIYK